MAAKKSKIPQDPMFEMPKTRQRRQPSGVRKTFDETRRFHGWTQDKLEVLRLYLRMFWKVAGNGTYIDTCAGDGQALIRGVTQPGSVALAMSAGTFKQLHFFEKEEMIDRLRFFLDYTYPVKLRNKARVHPGDVNVELPKLLASGVIPRDKSCFAFVDPDSTEVDWATIAALAGYKIFDPSTKPILCKVEMWILVNTGHALRRLWPSDRSKYPLPPPDSAKTLDRVMGARGAWVDLYKAGESSTQLAYRYTDRLRSEFGYQYTVAHPIRRGSSRSGIQYFMVHATDHPAAVDFMTWAAKTPTEKIAREAELPL